jgi:hypothetical protein
VDGSHNGLRLRILRNICAKSERLRVLPWRDCNGSFTIAKPSPFLPWSPCGIFTTRCGGGDRIVA